MAAVVVRGRRKLGAEGGAVNRELVLPGPGCPLRATVSRPGDERGAPLPFCCLCGALSSLLSPLLSRRSPLSESPLFPVTREKRCSPPDGPKAPSLGGKFGEPLKESHRGFPSLPFSKRAVGKKKKKTFFKSILSFFPSVCLCVFLLPVLSLSLRAVWRRGLRCAVA